MYKFRAKSNLVLIVLSVLALFALIAVENGKTYVEQEWFDEKTEAAELSQLAAETLKNHRMEKGVFIDAINDPNQTALIGQEYTLTTTDRGYIDSKLSSTNPNFAAVIVQLLKDAGVRKGDNVAIAFTGSFPALNISVLAAIQTLEINPIPVTSVGASNFGANDPYFTWLDMETVLYDAGVFEHKSVAASIGGGNDVGRGLSPEGRDLIIESIHRNKVDFIYEKYLENSIAARMEIYQKHSNERPIKAYINVGGGIASLGNTINGKIIPPGLTEYLPMRNFPVRGVIIQMGQSGVPIIHLLNISKLLAEYDLPGSPVPLPEPGEGGIFTKEKYDVVVAGIATAVLVVVILMIYLSEKKYHRLGTDVVMRHEQRGANTTDTDDIPVL
jgi:poly-gamma-glutamate system protein